MWGSEIYTVVLLTPGLARLGLGWLAQIRLGTCRHSRELSGTLSC